MNKKALATLFVLLGFAFVVPVEASSELWRQTYGGSSYETAYSVIETSDGGYAIAGGTTSFGNGEYDFWLIKTDKDGNMEWNQTYGGTKDDVAHSVIETSDGGYALAGSTNGTNDISDLGRDFWLVKTDEYGNMQWNQTYGGADDDYASTSKVTSDGGYVLAGTTDSFGAGRYDFWLVKTDEHGNMQWNQTYGGEDNDGCGSLVETTDGGFVLAGSTSPNILGSPRDVLLVKTDAYGNMEWNRTFGGASYEYACSLVGTSDGGYAFAGYTRSFGAGLDDFWLVKIDTYGNMEWNQTYGGTDYDDASALVVTSDGGFALAGHTLSFGSGNYDFWLIKTDAYGNMEWNQMYGGEGYEDANSLVQTSDGGYVLAGAINSVYATSDWLIIKTDAQGIPEFPSGAILPLLLTIILVVTIYRKRLTKKPTSTTY
jgi:hypothetical protein